MMKFLIIFSIAILVGLTPAFAQESLITIQTDDRHYDEGDTIVVSGQVSVINGDSPVIMQLFTEGNLVDNAQLTVAQDGSFTKTFLAEGALWKKSGDYNIIASYQEHQVETGFSYTVKSETIETTTNFEVDAGNYGSFDVKYSILGGTVKDMVIRESDFSLIVQISSTDEGYITLKLPRAVIGAEKQNGVDDTFIVLIDGVEVGYNETDFDFVSRVIKVNFEQGDSDIKILGTYLLETPQSIPQSEPVEDGWTSIDDLTTIDEASDPDVTISRLQDEIRDLKLENRELKMQIEDMKNILMEQVRVIMKWFS